MQFRQNLHAWRGVAVEEALSGKRRVARNCFSCSYNCPAGSRGERVTPRAKAVLARVDLLATANKGHENTPIPGALHQLDDHFGLRTVENCVVGVLGQHSLEPPSAL